VVLPIPEWHTDAFNAGTHMDKFIELNPNILERIKNKTITGKEIKIAAYTFNIQQLDYKITGLGFQLKKATKKNDKDAAESLQKKIDNLNAQKAEQTKKLEEVKNEKQ
jgi:seryl-tRNA synthetase